jgi:hypothetical protein
MRLLSAVPPLTPYTQPLELIYTHITATTYLKKAKCLPIYNYLFLRYIF